MRDEEISLAEACKLAGVSIRTFLKYAHGAIRRDRLGRYMAKPSDKLSREISSTSEQMAKSLRSLFEDHARQHFFQNGGLPLRSTREVVICRSFVS